MGSNSESSADTFWAQLLAQHGERQCVSKISTKGTITAQLVGSDEIQTQRYDLSAGSASLLGRVAEERNVCPSAVHLTTWHVLLANYFNCSQTIIGMTSGPRDSSILPSILEQGQDDSFVQLLQQVVQDYKTGQAIGSPTSSSVRTLCEKSISHVFCEVENELEVWTMNYPLYVLPSKSGLSLTLLYSPHVFTPEDISGFLNTYALILEQALTDLEIKLSAINLISKEEELELLEQVQKVNIDSACTMIGEFEKTCEKFPNRLALISGDVRLTYEQVDRKANQLGHFLSSISKIDGDTVFPICTQQDESMVIAILGIWKAGAAYVALDPTHPADRRNQILELTQCSVLITDDTNIGTVQSSSTQFGLQVVNMSSFAYSEYSDTRPARSSTGDSLSHIIFTSGTTGAPKGIMTLHGGLVNETRDYETRYRLEKDEVILCIFNYIFNAFSEPLTLALSQGFPLVLARSVVMDTAKLEACIRRNGVTHIDGTPSLVDRLNLSRLTSVRRVALGGEIFTKELYCRIHNQRPDVGIYNVYGVSEGTLVSLYARLENAESQSFARTVVNREVYVLNRYRQLCPRGALGEMYLSGLGLVRGYYKIPAVTAAAFIDGWRGRRVFKTGDLGQREAGGRIKFWGRGDFQVKIRGFRVELIEIEKAFLAHEEITQALVVLKKGEVERRSTLVGFYISKEPIPKLDLFRHLQRKLPPYMLPSALIWLERFPVTVNGKVDRKALENYEIVQAGGGEEDVGGAEQISANPHYPALVKIWEEVLGIPGGTVGLEATFDANGGNSLLGIELMERVNEELGLDLEFTHIFVYPSIALFLENIEGHTESVEEIP